MSARSNVAAMTEALVHLERRADGVAVVRLDNGKVNALSTALLAQLTAVAEQLQDDPPGAVVITGGDRLFAAGAEISEFLSRSEEHTSELQSLMRISYAVFCLKKKTTILSLK